jgi:hypothetical protein
MQLLQFLKREGGAGSHLGSGVGRHCPKPASVKDKYVDIIKRWDYFFKLSEDGYTVRLAEPPQVL